MNLTEYQQAVARTCATQEAGQAETLKLALVGLQDELGEVAGPPQEIPVAWTSPGPCAPAGGARRCVLVSHHAL